MKKLLSILLVLVLALGILPAAVSAYTVAPLSPEAIAPILNRADVFAKDAAVKAKDHGVDNVLAQNALAALTAYISLDEDVVALVDEDYSLVDITVFVATIALEDRARTSGESVSIELIESLDGAMTVDLDGYGEIVIPRGSASLGKSLEKNPHEIWKLLPTIVLGTKK